MDIRIQQLQKLYQDKPALENINLVLQPGSFTAIVGPSGCGKTTLIRALAGLVPINGGSIIYGEEDVTDLPPQHRQTAMVFQNYALWPHMTVFENVAYGLKLRKLAKAEIEQKVMSILEKVEIDTSDLKKRHPQQYSGGQQQRIALARALVLEPKLLLLDEPLSNLDAKVRQRLRVEIRRIQQDLGITAVYVTHDQEEALSMADQVVVMNKGRIEQAGTPEEVYRRPASYFVAHFLGNSNTLEVIRKDGDYRVGGQSFKMAEWLDIKGENLQLVVRGEEVKCSFDQPSMTGHLTFAGRLRESLFVGSGYRHWIEIEGQNLFIESDSKLQGTGSCYVHLPINQCFLFAKQTDKEAREIEA
jgi:ABC-type Fe3+/spermidine/putrescine transport system ATPase subunit